MHSSDRMFHKCTTKYGISKLQTACECECERVRDCGPWKNTDS